MKKINNKRLMVTCSIMKFEMPCFSVNKNRSHNKIKLYLDGVLGQAKLQERKEKNSRKFLVDSWKNLEKNEN